MKSAHLPRICASLLAVSIATIALPGCKPDAKLPLTDRMNFIVDNNTNLAPFGYRTSGMSGVSASALYPTDKDATGVPAYSAWNRAAGISYSEQKATEKVDVKVTTDMKFTIGSQSKLYTSVILLKLAEAGYMTPEGDASTLSLDDLSLDDLTSDERVQQALDSTLNQWLPKLQQHFPALKNRHFDDRPEVCDAQAEPTALSRPDNLINFVCGEITLRQLLNERSGLADHISTGQAPYNESLMALYPPLHFDQTKALPDVTDLVLNHVPPNKFAPGAGFNYANTGFLILELVIEAAVNAQTPAVPLSFADVFNQIMRQDTVGSLGIQGMGLTNLYSNFQEIPGANTNEKQVAHGWSTFWNDDLLCLNANQEGKSRCMYYTDSGDDTVQIRFGLENTLNLFNLDVHEYQDNLAVATTGAQVFNLNAWDRLAGPAGSNYAKMSDAAQFAHQVIKGEALASSALLNASEFIATTGSESYGLGLRKRTHPNLGTLYYHGGLTPFHSSLYIYSPNLDATVVIAFNSVMTPSTADFKDLPTVIAEELLLEIQAEQNK